MNASVKCCCLFVFFYNLFQFLFHSPIKFLLCSRPTQSTRSPPWSRTVTSTSPRAPIPVITPMMAAANKVEENSAHIKLSLLNIQRIFIAFCHHLKPCRNSDAPTQSRRDLPEYFYRANVFYGPASLAITDCGTTRFSVLSQKKSVEISDWVDN